MSIRSQSSEDLSDYSAQAQRAEVLNKYERTEVIGEGAYGIVYKARNRYDGAVVAVKKIRLYDDAEEKGVPKAVLREVGLLKELDHCNVVRLLDVIHSAKRLMLVFEFVDGDLKTFMDNIQPNGAMTNARERIGLPAAKVKHVINQILQGVAFCHQHRVLHRDLKPHNILVTADCKVKLADFGLARLLSLPSHSYTHEVVTLWYRAPELLLGTTQYGTPVDVWSVGCMFSEIFTGLPLFPGQSEVGQLFKIFRIKGTPSSEHWTGVEQLQHWQAAFPQFISLPQHRLAAASLGSLGLDLLSCLLAYDPNSRMDSRDALRHPYFAAQPSVRARQATMSPKEATGQKQAQKQAQAQAQA